MKPDPTLPLDKYRRQGAPVHDLQKLTLWLRGYHAALKAEAARMRAQKKSEGIAAKAFAKGLV